MYKPQPDLYKACRPFNRERFGVMLGEGAGVYVPERADSARERGATIHGMLRGYATLADGFQSLSPEPEGKWEQRVIELALIARSCPVVWTTWISLLRTGQARPWPISPGRAP